MEINDPTDWPGSMPELRTIDNLLRCSICYEFLKTAMILPGCSHNFCSLCIRRYLPQENKCPSCKKPSSIPELKNNRVLDELVKNFVAVRPHILKLCLDDDVNSPKSTKPENNKSQTTPNRSVTTPRRSGRTRGQPASSYKSQDSTSSDEAPPTSVKSSPSKQSSITKHFRSKPKDARLSRAKDAANTSQSAQSSDDDFVVTTTPASRIVTTTPSRIVSLPSTQISLNKSNEEEENIAPEVVDEDCMIVEDGGEASTSSDSRPPPSPASKKDKASCPVCGVSVQPKYINAHLDACLLKGDKRESKRRTPQQRPKRKPLPKLVYNLLSEKDIRKKLKEYKLPHQGKRQVLVKRLQEFTLLYNSECDSEYPKPVEALVKEVLKMEKVKVQQPSQREQRVTRLKVEKGQSQEEMEKHQKDYLKAHKNQFDKLVQEAKERMKKAHVRMSTKNEPSTSNASVQEHDENSRDSVTITDIKTSTDAKLNDAGTVCKDTAAGEHSENSSGAGHDNKLATVGVEQAAVDKPAVTESDDDIFQDKQNGNKDSGSKNNARVSLSFDTNRSGEDCKDKGTQEMEPKGSSINAGTMCASEERNGRVEKMDVESSSTESMEGNTDDSIEEPDSPSLLCSQAVLGDSGNYSVSMSNGMNRTSTNLAHSGLLDTLMSDDDNPTSSNDSAVLVPPSPSATSKAGDDLLDSNEMASTGLLDTLMSDDDNPTSSNDSAVLVPPSPSATSKAGDDLLDSNEIGDQVVCDSLQVEDDSPAQLDSVDHDSPAQMDGVDLNCIPESPQPSTSGIRQRKRRKVEPCSTNSESGSSIGDDSSVGLRRSRRAKKPKANE